MARRTWCTYELYDDPTGKEPQEPMGESFSRKADALKALASYREDYPNAYVVKVVYARCRDDVAKKGRHL